MAWQVQAPQNERVWIRKEDISLTLKKKCIYIFCAYCVYFKNKLYIKHMIFVTEVQINTTYSPKLSSLGSRQFGGFKTTEKENFFDQ